VGTVGGEGGVVEGGDGLCVGGRDRNRQENRHEEKQGAIHRKG
jgi:hypothetical protein